MKVLIIGLLVAIVLSMGHAMVSMVSGPQDNKRMVNALTIRVGLSIALFVLLFIGWHFGWIEQNGL
jgi:hypothetical protein